MLYNMFSLIVCFIHLLSHSSRVQLSEIQRALVLPASLSMGFSRKEYWSELPCLPPRDLPDFRGSNLWLFHLLYWQADSLPLAPPGKLLFYTQWCVNKYNSLNLPIHPTSAFPPWSPWACSLHLHLYFCFANVFLCIIFLDSRYML